jgi:hypothetical protein
MAISRVVSILAVALLLSFLQNNSVVLTKECVRDHLVYGESGMVDELLTCCLSKSFDLDLTPHGDHVKSTSKTLVGQGLSNRTSILHARLSGVWTAKRPGFIETGWLCDENMTTNTAIIELSNLSLEVVEKIDVPISRNQHKFAMHRPCKTFDLPTWMCRQTKPIYRTINTWVNRAYYNLTLTQNLAAEKPSISKLASMFTCPEAFKQRITHSPSSTYLLTRHSSHIASTVSSNQQNHSKKPTKREFRVKNLAPKNRHNIDEVPELGHPNSFTTTQSSNMPASPLYHNSVNVITTEVAQALRSSIDACIDSQDINLNLVRDYRSFRMEKYNLEDANRSAESDAFGDDAQTGITNECSNKLWIKSRLELTNQLDHLEEEATTKLGESPSKRNRISSGSQPDGLGELLDPYGVYHDPIGDRMID